MIVPDISIENIQKKARIAKLIAEGNDREAYRIFEELPLKDQLALGVSPVLGEALAAYEVGEFGRRAEERSALDDKLGAFGNRILQTFAGVGTIPAIGVLGRGGVRVGKELTKLARKLDDFGGGGGESVRKTFLKNSYEGTRPDPDIKVYDTENADVGFENENFLDVEGIQESLSEFGSTTGKPLKSLISPSIAKLEELAAQGDDPVFVPNLIRTIIKSNPRTAGELRMLKAIDIDENLSKDLLKSPDYRRKMRPSELAAYLNRNQLNDNPLRVKNPSPYVFPQASPQNINAEFGHQRQAFYQVDGVKNIEGTHNFAVEDRLSNPVPSMGYDKFLQNPNKVSVYTDDGTIAFSGYDSKDGFQTLRMNRIQSDYAKDLSETSKIESKFEPRRVKVTKPDGSKTITKVTQKVPGNPFRMGPKEKIGISYLNPKKNLKAINKIEKQINKYNKLAQRSNEKTIKNFLDDLAVNKNTENIRLDPIKAQDKSLAVRGSPLDRELKELSTKIEDNILDFYKSYATNNYTKKALEEYYRLPTETERFFTSRNIPARVEENLSLAQGRTPPSPGRQTNYYDDPFRPDFSLSGVDVGKLKNLKKLIKAHKNTINAGPDKDFLYGPDQKFLNIKKTGEIYGPKDGLYESLIKVGSRGTESNYTSFAGYIDSKSTIDKVENSVDALLDGLKYGSEVKFLNKFPPDPYANLKGTTTVGSQVEVFPIRYMLNEAAQITPAKKFIVDIEEMSKTDMFGTAGNVRNRYKKVLNEANKVGNELGIGDIVTEDPGNAVLKKARASGDIGPNVFGGKYYIDLEKIRQELAKGKSINAFKKGGFVTNDNIEKDLQILVN